MVLCEECDYKHVSGTLQHAVVLKFLVNLTPVKSFIHSKQSASTLRQIGYDMKCKYAKLKLVIIILDVS